MPLVASSFKEKRTKSRLATLYEVPSEEHFCTTLHHRRGFDSKTLTAYCIVAAFEFEFNEKQIDCIALQMWPVEQAWRVHLRGKQSACVTVATLRKLPNGLGLPEL